MAMMTFASDVSANALAHERVVPLREWLDGHWGAVFSHPDDFAPAPTTPPGYVTCVADLVLAAGIKPLAFFDSLDAQRSTWLDHAFDDDAVVLLNRDGARVVDLAEHALVSKLAALSARFVLVVDGAGHVRMTLKYAASEQPRTMMEIVHAVAALRDGRSERSTPAFGRRRAV